MARPPWRSSQRPTGTASSAPVSTLAANAPATAVVPMFRSVEIGVRKTANA
jgi:hypothetical protein